MILRIVQSLLISVYLILPVLVLAWSFAKASRGRLSTIYSLLIGCVGAAGAGVGLGYLNGWLLGGKLSPWEWARIIYFSIAVLCLIRVVDRGSLWAMCKLARVRLDSQGRALPVTHIRALGVLLIQRGLMLALALAYVLGLLMTYRPRVHLQGVPGDFKMQAKWAEFTTHDGVEIAGWWIAAEKPPAKGADDDDRWGKRTVLLCHGIGSGKERLFDLARLLSRRGFNVLVFDLRGHGESGGSFISYGDRERWDVLAAAQWAKANYPDRTQHLYGVGANTGAAALVAAAAEPGLGEQIEALVLCEPVAQFNSMMETTAERTLPRPVAWLVEHVSLPLASLHAGSDLAEFAPVTMVEKLWPRPVLMVHSKGKSFLSFNQTMGLYQAMPAPKEQFWPSVDEARQRLPRAKKDGDLLTEMFREFLGTQDGVLDDAGVRWRMLKFLREAEAAPVI